MLLFNYLFYILFFSFFCFFLLSVSFFYFFISSVLHRVGHCPEYSVDDQVFCAVGLAKAKPGIFVEAIQYLLILATPAEVAIFPSIFCCTC